MREIQPCRLKYPIRFGPYLFNGGRTIYCVGQNALQHPYLQGDTEGGEKPIFDLEYYVTAPPLHIGAKLIIPRSGHDLIIFVVESTGSARQVLSVPIPGKPMGLLLGSHHQWVVLYLKHQSHAEEELAYSCFSATNTKIAGAEGTLIGWDYESEVIPLSARIALVRTGRTKEWHVFDAFDLSFQTLSCEVIDCLPLPLQTNSQMPLVAFQSSSQLMIYARTEGDWRPWFQQEIRDVTSVGLFMDDDQHWELLVGVKYGSIFHYTSDLPTTPRELPVSGRPLSFHRMANRFVAVAQQLSRVKTNVIEIDDTYQVSRLIQKPGRASDTVMFSENSLVMGIGQNIYRIPLLSKSQPVRPKEKTPPSIDVEVRAIGKEVEVNSTQSIQIVFTSREKIQKFRILKVGPNTSRNLPFSVTEINYRRRHDYNQTATLWVKILEYGTIDIPLRVKLETESRQRFEQEISPVISFNVARIDSTPRVEYKTGGDMLVIQRGQLQNIQAHK